MPLFYRHYFILLSGAFFDLATMPRPKRQLRTPSRLSGIETPAKRSRGTYKKGKVPSGSGVTVGNVTVGNAGASTYSSSGHDNVSSADSTLNNFVFVRK